MTDIPEFRNVELQTPGHSVDVISWIRTLHPDELAYLQGAAHGRLAARLGMTEADLFAAWAQRAAADPDCQVIRPW